MQYQDFLQSKIKIAESTGFDLPSEAVSATLFPHQKDVVRWAVDGGRRAVFAAFGLGKTFMQLEIAKHIVAKTGKPFLIGIPLGVKHEFQLDAEKLNLKVNYVKDASDVTEPGIYLSNYERIRDAKFDASVFGGVSFDEASVLRGLDTQTSDYILNNFMDIKYRFVCTATPSPNEYTEILNYAHFLGIMDRGQALTRYFQRDSSKAGNLTIYPHKEAEFWMWVSSWAVFITKPSDIGHDNTGYDLPELKVIYHRVDVKEREFTADRDGNLQMFANPAKSLVDASKEKRNSMLARVAKMKEIIEADPLENYIIWHHQESERTSIEKAIPPRSNSEYVWDDVSRMHTLNNSQSKRKQEKHVCPLQFDIVDRLINRYSNEGETVLDPFGGIMTVPFRAIKLKRFGVGIELNKQYWNDGVRYCKEAEYKANVPSLFDTLTEVAA